MRTTPVTVVVVPVPVEVACGFDAFVLVEFCAVV
jgi:hypothetical protein